MRSTTTTAIDKWTAAINDYRFNYHRMRLLPSLDLRRRTGTTVETVYSGHHSIEYIHEKSW